MRIDDINSLFLTPKTHTLEVVKQTEASFATWLGEQISTTNTQLNEADHALTQLARGKSENLHQTMLTMEQAKLSFQLLEQIRNRLMSSYQDILREQI